MKSSQFLAPERTELADRFSENEVAIGYRRRADFQFGPLEVECYGWIFNRSGMSIAVES